MAQKKDTPVDIFNKSRISIFMQSTLYTVFFIALFAGGGYLLDQYLQTQPKFLIAGIALGYPATQFLIFKRFKKIAAKKLKDNQ